MRKNVDHEFMAEPRMHMFGCTHQSPQLLLELGDAVRSISVTQISAARCAAGLVVCQLRPCQCCWPCTRFRPSDLSKIETLGVAIYNKAVFILHRATGLSLDGRRTDGLGKKQHLVRAGDKDRQDGL